VQRPEQVSPKDIVGQGMSERTTLSEVNFKTQAAQQLGRADSDSRGGFWAGSVAQDLRFALRTLRKHAGFAATAVLTLALGIGANTAIFQLMDAVRLRQLPVADPQRLAGVQIQNGNKNFGINLGDTDTMLTYPLWEELQRHQEPFSDLFAWADSGSSTLGEGGQQRRARALWITDGMFSTLGLRPYRGRFFAAEEMQPGCGAPGIVISHALWQNEFGGQDFAIGKKLVVSGRLTEVLGVAPLGFFGLEVGKNFDFLLPFCSLQAYFPGGDTLARRDFFWVRALGRLKPGWSLQRASSHLDAMSPGLIERTLPSGYTESVLATYRKFRLAAYPGGTGVSWLRQTYDTSLQLLLGTTGLVLLIACANLANLLLARASTREREMAVRLALGASRWRLIRQLLSESVVLAAGGALAGMGLAHLFSKSLVKFLSTEGDAIQLDLSMDWRVLLFTGLIAVVTCVLFGLVPAFRSARAEPGDTLKGGSRGSTPTRERFSFQRLLVVAQLAVSVVLLVGALLFVRSFWNLINIDPGFRQQGILIAYLDFKRAEMPVDRTAPFIRDLLTQVRNMPQVESAATSTHVPLNGSAWNLGVRAMAAEGPSRFTWVSPGYFQTMQIPLLAGRDFNDGDTAKSPRVAIVNETFVRKYLGGEYPLGKTIRTNPEPQYPEAEYQIVGLIRDTKYGELREPTPPMAFGVASQFPAAGPWALLFVRFASQPASLTATMRDKFGQANPAITMEFHIFQTDIANRLMRERLMAVLSGFFGGLAALLAMVGLYGVISYIVAMRRNEIGIRMALGATRRSVIGLILKQTLYLLALGVTLGLVLSFAVTRGAGSLLFGLQPNDPLSLGGAAAFLASVALLASYLPARRASHVDPMTALRYE
jgi:predicted permease